MPKMSVKRDVNSIENDREDLYNLYSPWVQASQWYACRNCVTGRMFGCQRS